MKRLTAATALLLAGSWLLLEGGASASTPSRGCKERVEGGRPIPFRRDGDIRIGPVHFAALARAATDPTLRPRPDGRPIPYKAGVGVRAGRTVTISIAPADRSFARLVYVGRHRLNELEPWPVKVKLRACDADEPAFSYDGPVGEVTGFSGGFLLAGPRCVTVEVRVKGSSRIYRRAVSFGAGACQ